MDIVGAFEKAFLDKEKNNWDKIYVLVDVHDTIMQGTHKEDDYLWYPQALEVLKEMSDMDDICLILWTGSHKETIDTIITKLKVQGICFDYINENPEVGDTNFYCSSVKLYFNVGIDDRFGFDVERDWNAIKQYLLLKKRMDKIGF